MDKQITETRDELTLDDLNIVVGGGEPRRSKPNAAPKVDLQHRMDVLEQLFVR